MGSINEPSAVENVAIIGAGPAGLAAAKYLLAEKAFAKIVIFEQRLNVGGVWNATPSLVRDENFNIPQTTPSSAPNLPAWDVGVGGDGKDAFDFMSPIYDDLDTNIPYSLMEYSDHHFPAGTPLFPRHEVVLGYLERYADDIQHLLKLGTQVLDVRASIGDGNTDKWSITTRDIKTSEEIVYIFDAVIIANGHYDTPFIPDIPGIRQWNDAYPGSISHSKYYRRVDEFRGKKVLVIGTSASGTDLAAHIAPICKPPLLISSHSPPPKSPNQSNPLTLTLPQMAYLNPLSHTVTFSNGHTEADIDHLLFCTGYLYSFPFLQHLSPPLSRSDTHVPTLLHQHLLYRPRPTLSLLTLPQRIVPFPLAEAQAAVVARLLSGRLAFPSAHAMQAWESQRWECDDVRGDARRFHVLGYPADAEYINSLYAWAMSALPCGPWGVVREGERKMGDGVGKVPPYWGEEECWVREQTPLIKQAARELGPEKRAEVRTLRELGFEYIAGERGRRGVGGKVVENEEV